MYSPAYFLNTREYAGDQALTYAIQRGFIPRASARLWCIGELVVATPQAARTHLQAQRGLLKVA